MAASKPARKTGTCLGCKRRRVLGRCSFTGGGVDKMDHCRGCCDAPKVLKWKPSLVAAVMRLIKRK